MADKPRHSERASEDEQLALGKIDQYRLLERLHSKAIEEKQDLEKKLSDYQKSRDKGSSGASSVTEPRMRRSFSITQQMLDAATAQPPEHPTELYQVMEKEKNQEIEVPRKKSKDAQRDLKKVQHETDELHGQIQQLMKAMTQIDGRMNELEQYFQDTLTEEERRNHLERKQILREWAQKGTSSSWVVVNPSKTSLKNPMLEKHTLEKQHDATSYTVKLLEKIDELQGRVTEQGLVKDDPNEDLKLETQRKKDAEEMSLEAMKQMAELENQLEEKERQERQITTVAEELREKESLYKEQIQSYKEDFENEQRDHSITRNQLESQKNQWTTINKELQEKTKQLTAMHQQMQLLQQYMYNDELQKQLDQDIDLEMRRTEQMLCWSERGSEKQFLDFCDALQACNQSFIVSEFLSPKNQERKIPESKIPESNLTQPDPLLIQKIPVKPHDIRGDPEGAVVVVPLPLEIAVGNIRFVPCNQEFLKTFQAKVLKKVAYRCESRPRGRALIMNNRFFSVNHLGTRRGSDVDTDNLKALFISLHFDTVVHSDKDAEEMWDILKMESQQSHHKGYDIFVLFLMSHGIQGEIYGVDGKPLETAAIANLFNGKNCPSLLEKPKLFFIQACQGNIKTPGVMTTATGMMSCDSGMTATDSGMTECDSPMPVQHKNATMEEMMRKLSLAEDFQMSIPLPLLPKFASDAVADAKVHEMADMAMIYATVDGYVAWRRVDTGSLFVQCFIDVLAKRAHETDLIGMITEVSTNLHELEMVENQGRFKQISEKRDSLRREVYLLPI